MTVKNQSEAIRYLLNKAKFKLKELALQVTELEGDIGAIESAMAHEERERNDDE
jgi:hypothetical protein